LKLGDALVNSARPTAGQLSPVRSFRYPAVWQLGQLCRNLVERHPDALREDNKCDPP
jgi:hypothetical protein